MPLVFAGDADHMCVKNVSCVQDADLYGHGGHSPAFVPTFGSVLPTRMVRHWRKRHHHSITSADTHRESNCHNLLFLEGRPQVLCCHYMKGLLAP